MDNKSEEEIILIVLKNTEEFGFYSIKQAAHSMFYRDISLSEQKRIAKKIVKGNPFVTEIKNGEIIVKKNASYSETQNNNDEEDYSRIKYIVAAVVGILSYLVFKVLLPGLKN